jgi:CheY-like chemotaxis protein
MKKIVLAEDEPSMRLLIAETLRDHGQYQLFLAGDGCEALEIVRRERPDLLLLDVDVPLLNGFAVCQQMRADPCTRQVPVVMITAMAQDHYRREAAMLGVAEYFTKPFSPLALLRKVEELLGC